jgi:hypothetical protein
MIVPIKWLLSKLDILPCFVFACVYVFFRPFARAYFVFDIWAVE